MNKIEDIILKSTEAKSFQKIEVIQQLWSGYGEIVRYVIEGGKTKSIVVKQVQLPIEGNHPHDWNTDLSHQRKVKSYQVELAWYTKYNEKCDNTCRVPNCLAVDKVDGEMFLVLEDLDQVGYSVRKKTVSLKDMELCLSWLANFHATFMNEKPNQLWEIGTYWHLSTRPDELEVLKDIHLKKVAHKIDQKLNESSFLTFVHGDAKLANFCFSKEGQSVAAVDFQYVGGGCGMKDVVYFIGSCLDENKSREYEKSLLDFYFKKLRLGIKSKSINIDMDKLEEDWRRLFPCAWADFHRFLKGWSPNHWKINNYSERITQEVIKQLK